VVLLAFPFEELKKGFDAETLIRGGWMVAPSILP
jgi:hypothetical protein